MPAIPEEATVILGYGPADIRASDYYVDQLDIQQELFESATLWVWKEQSQGAWGLFDHDATTGAWTARGLASNVVGTARIVRIAGMPVTTTDSMHVTFDGDATITAPSTVWFPADGWFHQASCDGATPVALVDGTSDVACGGPGRHTLVLSEWID